MAGRGGCCRGCGDMGSGDMRFWSRDSHQTSAKQCKSAASVWVLSSCNNGHAGKGPLAATPTQNGECTCSEALLGIRPAARVSLPMWMMPRRKVPVVMTTLLHSTRSPAASRHPSLKGLRGQPCTDCMSLASCSAAATLVWGVTVQSASRVTLSAPSTPALYANACSAPQPLRPGDTAQGVASKPRPA